MSILKTSIVFPHSTAIHSLSPSAATCNTSRRCFSTRDSRYHEQRRQHNVRSYATVTDNDAQNRTIDLSWPETPKGRPCPSPYQILALARTAPYSKSRFYELVKIYHPDRGSQDPAQVGCGNVPHTTKLERYRLLVAAHAILSDPVKRSAYDQWGAGWAGAPESKPTADPTSPSSGPPGPFTSSWQATPDPSIWQNATWEDWERWRHKQQSHKGQTKESQSPLYLQNSTFISVILVLAAVGSSLNYNRAGAEGGRFLAARDVIHDQASKDLRKVRQMTNQRAKNERIEWFLKNREAALLGMGIEELVEEKVRRVLPPPENCGIGEDDSTP